MSWIEGYVLLHVVYDTTWYYTILYNNTFCAMQLCITIHSASFNVNWCHSSISRIAYGASTSNLGSQHGMGMEFVSNLFSFFFQSLWCQAGLFHWNYYNTQSVSQMQFMLQQGVWASWCSNKLIHINARTYGGNKPHNKVQENEHCCFAHQREWKTNPLTLITFYQASRLGGCTPSYVFAYTSVRDLFIWGGYLPCRKDYKVMVFYM